MNKTILTFALSIISFGFLIAQNFPYGINYQAVARDANSNAKTNATIGTRYTLRSTSLTGPVVWQETQTVITNAMGQFNHTFGMGTRIGGTAINFSDISWISAAHYLEVEIQIGASPYSSIGNQQLMSVPYALSTPGEVPTGSVMAFFGTIPPAGWLVCDGQAISRTVYSKLFTTMGIASGNGDGTTTFNVPDLRGMFLRGLDNRTTGNEDPDAATRIANNPGGNTGASTNKIGSEEFEAFKSHNHSSIDAAMKTGSGGGTASTIWFNGTSNAPTTNAGGNETRPKNVFVNYIIKY